MPKILFLFYGWLTVALAVAGIFLPTLPTYAGNDRNVSILLYLEKARIEKSTTEMRPQIYYPV